MPLGELTLTGSISEQSFTRTVASDTTDVYVMPEGSLYWYGNFFKKMVKTYHKDQVGDANLTVNTNYFVIQRTSGMFDYMTEDKINLSKFTSCKCIVNASGDYCETMICNTRPRTQNTAEQYFGREGNGVYGTTFTSSCDISSISSDEYVGFCIWGNNASITCYALWLE